ncbi:Protein of unknown function [Prevotella communis]|uniref:DUF2971 domain-containing protein n=1 Tax=Prevotella communis TaxID=2913614 RepID=A0A1H0KTD9_9BACT|nr:DUF2971 domain-containing protein [Prevotella communis]SDG62522.1 Protein of unknown function [Prevotella communis]SDO59053.1 Protein of unknown function [Prevotella communis]
MKIFHYTTLDSLAMIMSSRSIKFNRLDKVDDLEERTEPSKVKLWQYLFVSCWTENPEESIPLWRMYSGNAHGVRIGMDIDMFEDNIVGGNNVPVNISHEGLLVRKIPVQDFFRKDYFVLPAAVRYIERGKDTLFYCHVDYVDDVNEKTKDAYQLTKTDAIHASSHISFGEIGKYKNKRWAFQEETRFRLVVMPFNPIFCNPDIVSTIAVNAFHQSKPVPISEYFLKLRTEALNNMEITLHPNATASDRVIVDALCAKYAQGATIKESELRDRVVMK